jgi:hypothetical protein
MRHETLFITRSLILALLMMFGIPLAVAYCFG